MCHAFAVADELLDRTGPWLLDQPNFYGNTLLCSLAYADDAEAIAYALRRGANPDLPRTKSPLACALECFHVNAARALLACKSTHAHRAEGALPAGDDSGSSS